jgi:hypothetical protein
MGISFHMSPLGNLGKGVSTEETERWMNVALRLELLSLKRLTAEGLEGGFFTGESGL